MLSLCPSFPASLGITWKANLTELPFVDSDKRHLKGDSAGKIKVKTETQNAPIKSYCLQFSEKKSSEISKKVKIFRQPLAASIKRPDTC